MLAPRWAIAILMIALALCLIAPVEAHTTIGNLTGSDPLYRLNDHELNPEDASRRYHVPGPLGYVWPGSGVNMYSGVASYPPGYQSPFTTYEKPLQVAGTAYAPEGAILTSTGDHDSVGDLIFAINFSQPTLFTAAGADFNYSSLALYIPAPVFDKTGKLIQDGFEPAGGLNWDLGENTNIVTTLTDNYGSIFVTRADKNDPYMPGSWLIYITPSAGMNFTFPDYDEWYYVRINQMKAPFVAGRYFFKFFLGDHYPVRSSTPSTPISSTMPMENWPVLLAKGEVDPGIIWGTVRHGDMGNQELFGFPISLAGRVRAAGYATHPVSGELTGRAVEAHGYFNSSSHGHFEIEGVAPGIYDIYASAAGYPELKVAENVRIHRGQSLMMDACLLAGPEVRGEVFSKEEFGVAEWPGDRPVSVVIYDSNTYDSDSIVSYSPTNLTHAPFTSYVTGNVIYDSGTGYTTLKSPNVAKKVAFPWEGPLAIPGVAWVGSDPSDFDGTVKDDFGLLNGVGPAQHWWVDPAGLWTNGGGTDSFRFQFGLRSYYGVPTRLSGMVPQVFAEWTDSLSVGVYYVRVFMNGYVQTIHDGTQFVDAPFVIPDIGFSRDISIPIDVFRSGTINVTVHFHDLPGTIEDSPVGGPDPTRFLIAEASTGDGNLAAFNFTQVPASAESWNVTLNGLGMAGPIENDPLIFRTGVKYSLARYRGLFDYGLYPDTYEIRLFMRGYIQALPPAKDFTYLDQALVVSVSIGSKVAWASTHMYRGGGINATVYSTDWETPLVDRKWVWDNASTSVLVYDVGSKSFIDVIYFWNDNIKQWTIPQQDSDFTSIPWPTWKSDYGDGASYLVTNGSTFLERLGPDLPSFPSIDPSQDIPTVVFLQENFRSGFLWGSGSYRIGSRSSLAIYPGTYALNVWTYGYVQEDIFAYGSDLGNVHVSVGWLGSQADTLIKVMIGVNFTINMVFKTEGIFSGIPFNSSVRLRIFDESDTLVAAAILSSSKFSSTTGFLADGYSLDFPRYNTIPAGTRELEYVSLAGFSGYVEPRDSSQGVKSATLYSPDHGVWGRSTHAGSYTGSWLVMVDFVNWCSASSYYPPVPALLQGESPFFFPYNHLGPYQQRSYTRVPNVAIGGEASVVFELDLRGYVQGIVVGPDWNDAIRTISWASVQFRAGETTQNWYTWDGWFDGYLDPGIYEVSIAEWTDENEGHNSYQSTMAVSSGQVSTATSIVLDLSGKPIPEFLPFPILAVCIASFLVVVTIERNPKRGSRSSQS